MDALIATERLNSEIESSNILYLLLFYSWHLGILAVAMITTCGNTVHYIISPSAARKLRPRDHGKSIYFAVWPLGPNDCFSSPISPSPLSPPPPPHHVGPTVYRPHVQMHLQSSCPRIGLVRFLPRANHAAMGPSPWHSPVRLRCSRSASCGINFLYIVATIRGVGCSVLLFPSCFA